MDEPRLVQLHERDSRLAPIQDFEKGQNEEINLEDLRPDG